MIERAGFDRAKSNRIAPARPWSDLLPRLASAIVLIGAALATALIGGTIFVLFWLFAAAAVLWEWQALVGGRQRLLRFAVGAGALAIATRLVVAGQEFEAAAILALGFIGTALIASAGSRLSAAAGVAYACALIIPLTILRLSFPGGLESILWLFAVVWGTDIMAYFGGRLIGGPKLWLRLSPAKTWSGFLIGIVSGALAGLALKPIESPALPVFAIGLAAGAVAQGGDLFESWLKRRYGVKDASHLIPGHGGVMDRLDGFIAGAVFSAIVGVSHADLFMAGAGLFNW